jgi:hypothetical protein
MKICYLQLAALECAEEADPVAARIGAANTLVRLSGGGLKAFNTDWSAAISAVEAALGGVHGCCLVTLHCCTVTQLGLASHVCVHCCCSIIVHCCAVTLLGTTSGGSK